MSFTLIKQLAHLASLLAIALSQSVQIHIHISNGQFLCPGDHVFFTCVTRDSLTLEWRSDEYILQNYMFLFSAHDGIGRRIDCPASHDTFTNLTASRVEADVRVMESELHIRVEPNVPSPSVSCVHANGDVDTIKLHVLVNPSMGEMESNQVRTHNGRCLVHVSWTLPTGFSVVEMKHFLIAVNGTPIEDVLLNNKTIIMKAFPVCSCADHMISITAVNSCGNRGRTTSILVNSPEHIVAAKCDRKSGGELLKAGWIALPLMLLFCTSLLI